MIKSFQAVIIILLFILISPVKAVAADLVFMVLDHNSYIAHLAVDGLDLSENGGPAIRIITADDVTRRQEQMKQIIDDTPLIVVDVMGRELERFLTGQIDLTDKTLYALRGSLDDESLKKQGFLFDPDISGYYQHVSVENIQNMLRRVIHRHLDKRTTYKTVMPRPQLGLYHPDAAGQGAHAPTGIFTQIGDYEQWQQSRPGYALDKPAIGFFFFSSFLTQGQQEPVDVIIRRLEAEGFNVFPCYGKEQEIISQFMLDSKGKSRVDMILAFSFKFYNALTPELAHLLRELDVPIFSAISIYKDTIEQWRQSPVGIDALEVAWSLAVPEISGLIEPTVLAAKEKIADSKTGKEFFVSREIGENLDRLIPRLKNWISLQQKANNHKKVALMFYNHHQGKQNIGASYLNVFRSIETIIKEMRDDGYDTGSPLSEEGIKSLILTSARNVGSWAPGELDKMIDAGKLVRLPLSTYKQWFDTLPEDFKNRVIQQWGEPETAGIMVSDNDLIIPAVQVNNLVILPEPSRGWSDEPTKLYHDTTLYPHHQYLAVYLWLANAFKADAMIHLGTHSTYEWTPGKQAGLSPACPPEVLITDIPNIYPYIVDNVGEGIQAKRRGRGVMVSHLTPVLRKSGISQEYSRMAELINEIERARARGSITLAEKVEELMSLARSTGILSDLKDSRYNDHQSYHTYNETNSHTHEDPSAENPAPETLKADKNDPIDRITDETIHLLGHYLEDIKASMIPYGMHTFGISPPPEAIDEMAGAMIQFNPEINTKKIHQDIAACGPNEIKSLLKGLSGRYVHSGQGNDPIRNPNAIPTGKNFYGFNPGKIPTPAAWELGKKAAQQIIDNHIIKQGAFPQKVAVVLWATETLRNEGVNECTILQLIGVQPKWSKTGRIIGLELIKGTDLNRPRIDVMINASGLYRDMFPEKMLFLDRAIRLAEKQTDVENLIARHSAEIKTRLIQQGMDPEKASEMSRFRIFSEPPGAYGTGVGDMASGSSKWDDPAKVVDVYQNRLGYAFGENSAGRQWGILARNALSAQLSKVDVAVHSRSSNVYGLLDNDDMFQYLGGLSMAVRKEAGKAPETLITNQKKKGRVLVEDMGKTLGREMRARYLNPKWIQGMKAEGYAGAKAMSDFVEYLWGWNMTTPEKVDADKWQQSYEVYVKDKYGLELKEFFNNASPWAFQSLTGRMMETHRKGYWKADEKQLKTLAADYAKSVITKGLACCDHTCNNPLLNQMVVSIISIPGVLSPEMVEKFKLAVEQMAQQSLDKQVENRRQLIKDLAAPRPDQPQKESPSPMPPDQPDAQTVEGYKMEKIEKKDGTTQMTSSGIEWMALVAVMAILGIITWGARKQTI